MGTGQGPHHPKRSDSSAQVPAYVQREKVAFGTIAWLAPENVSADELGEVTDEKIMTKAVISWKAYFCKKAELFRFF